MDFARKQLEKYGWTDGKGLGKHENGISEALKPKLKRSVAGIGHDIAADLTDPWWNKLYDKAAKNVQVEEKNGKTKKIKTRDDTFQITNSAYHLGKSDSTQTEEYSDFFVKTAVLTNGGCREEKVKDSDSEHEKEDEQKKNVFKMTDEELFAACEGRTAHKGARHGLTATGKLARIERQEQMLLAHPKYTGYSHTKSKKHKKDVEHQSDMDLEVVETTNLNDEDSAQKKKKKKKRKRCISDETVACQQKESILETVPEEQEDMEIVKSDKKKSKKNNKDANFNTETEVIVKTKKMKKYILNEENVGSVSMETDVPDSGEVIESSSKVKKSKKKKNNK